ncbi:ParA family protein [Vibrio splendidus]|nr:AAA family ATPase [Vibrio splendidus]MCC4880531.1 ParA family protein [Vibrio splendidus]
MTAQETLDEVYQLASIAENVIFDKIREYCTIANKKDKRHFTLSDANTYLGTTKKTINAYCKKLDIDPNRFREEGAQWLIDIDDIYGIRDALHEEPKNKLKYPKFTRTPVQKCIKIAFANQKGGASKTTSAVNLASGLAMRHEQYRVLIVDLDKTQSMSTYYCPADPDAEDGLYGANDFTATDLMLETYKEDIPEGMSEGEYLVKHKILDTTIPNLKMIPARSKDAGIEKEIERMLREDPKSNPYKLLKDKLTLLDEHFDIIILDTAPAINYSVYNAIFAADLLYIPLRPTDHDFDVTLKWIATMPVMFETIVSYDFSGYERPIKFIAAQSEGSLSNTEIEGDLMRLFPNNSIPVSIMHSEALLRCSKNMMTVFDLSRSEYQYSYKKGFDEIVNNMNVFINNIKFEMDQVWNEQKRAA